MFTMPVILIFREMAKGMKPKQLESHFQELNSLSSPKVQLEQYQTPPHIAAHMLSAIQHEYGDIAGKTVLDLGCGCGTLAIGCVLLGAEKVVGVDIDKDAIDIATANTRQFEFTEEVISFVHHDVLEITPASVGQVKFDTVIMNPPFGTKDRPGIDLMFVQRALTFADRVYSMHKSSTCTKAFWSKKAEEWDVVVEPMWQIQFNIDNMFKFHTQPSVDIEVHLILFSKCTRS